MEISEIYKLKECFNSLDDDQSGSIGLKEIQEPLIGLGFANTTKEVQTMIDQVDDDKSGKIEFNEFLSIIRNSGDSQQTKNITEFFKNLSSGSYDTKDMSFSMFVCKNRRRHLLNAIFSKDEKTKKEGMKILENLKVQYE